MNNIRYTIQKTTRHEIYLHLQEVDNSFEPILSIVIDVDEFSNKIYKNAVRFEAWHDKRLVGMLSAYFNNAEKKEGFINHIAVIDSFRQQGVAKKLLKNCIKYGKNNGFPSIGLEVSMENEKARKIYEGFGFATIGQQGVKIQMINKLTGEN